MSMKEWAEREIAIACEKERGYFEENEGGWDYGCACYESALKVFKGLLEDGHSGFSIVLTKNILNRLIDGKPLTPIEDVDDIWNFTYEDGGYKHYQCKRMFSLFKTVSPDGKVKYSDNDRFYCIDIDRPDVTYFSGLISRIIDELYPITMPYNPSDKPMKVVCECLLCDLKNGDFDTLHVMTITDENGDLKNINRYFKEAEKGWDEIGEMEFRDRKTKALALKRGVKI